MTAQPTETAAMTWTPDSDETAEGRGNALMLVIDNTPTIDTPSRMYLLKLNSDEGRRTQASILNQIATRLLGRRDHDDVSGTR